MPQSLVKNYVHITFSTKERHPFIDDSIEYELFNYLGGICRENECYPIQIGGYSDHVHILCSLSKKITLVKLLEHIKSHSSSWIKEKRDKFKKFYWQKGYGCFSVNPTQISDVQKYIMDQHIHHKRISFQQEFLSFLKKYKVDYNEKYLWD